MIEMRAASHQQASPPAPKRLPAADLEHILEHTAGLWEELRGQRLFITGGTGFFGCWLLESFLWANDRLGLGAEVVVLTRDPEAFGRKAPHLATQPAIRLYPGDVRSFAFPQGSFSHIIHAAADTDPLVNRGKNPLEELDTIVAGTCHTLDFARYCGAKKFLLISSGAVYGEQPPTLTHIPEDYLGGPNPLHIGSAYGEGKRLAELLCCLYAHTHGLETKIVRCFSFVGPFLPLQEPYAILDFIRDGLQGGPIQVKGDGTPYRSYLYAGDLAIWLWTILIRGESCRPYNVGSDDDLTIGQLARIVAEQFEPAVGVSIAQKGFPGTPAQRYVPSTLRARLELALTQKISLAEAIKRTIDWYACQPRGLRKDQRVTGVS